MVPAKQPNRRFLCDVRRFATLERTNWFLKHIIAGEVMAAKIDLKSNVSIGVVPTHLKFVGGLAPDENGKMPRDADGRLSTVANMAKLCSESPAKITSVQVPYFPGLDGDDVAEMVNGFKESGLETHFIMMVGGADPMNPADEDKVVEMLVGGLTAAKQFGVKQVSSTSVEEWMQAGAAPRSGAAYDAAVAQNVKVHTRAVAEADIEGSSIEAWHIEFLRSGEFQTFTDVKKAGEVVAAMNEGLGRKFFKVLADAAHCGDSSLSIDENIAAIQAIAEAGELGIFHASAKTTRGCLSTDDGWIGALMTAAAQTGTLQYVFVELFHHEDPALEALRDLDSGHGLDTTDGRSYDEAVIDGVTDVARRLNNLVLRGLLAN
jgi:hypothetical protein